MLCLSYKFKIINQNLLIKNIEVIKNIKIIYINIKNIANGSLDNRTLVCQ